MAELDAQQLTIFKKLFERAAELPPERRAAFLDGECPDREMREDLLSLLEHAGTSPVGAEAIAAVAAAMAQENDPDGWLIGARLGAYRVESIVGHGGMGAVYRAKRDDAEFHQRVAIKLVRTAAASQGALARFKQERQILALLSHPNIARLLDGGSTPEGVPYLVMEFIEGEPITAWCQRHAPKLEDRIRLFMQVCEAVDHAHRSLVVHRDLKPANILVTQDGTPKLLDFGIAKLLDAGADAEVVTKTGFQAMTPDYASPEQIQGAPVTTASDVYSLGVVLYEVLTGERPYHVTSSSLADLDRLISKTEPRKPSSIETLPARMRRRLAGDLDNIVLMAMRRDVSRRYRSAAQLADDLRRHLLGLPVQARPDTLLYRTGKFLRRRWPAVTAGALVAGSLVTGTVVANCQARAARERFDQLREFARTVLVDLHARLSDMPGAAEARQALVAHVDDYLKKVAAQHAGDEAALATEFATTYLRLGEMQGATPEAISSFESGQKLLENKRSQTALSAADSLLLARLLAREGGAFLDMARATECIQKLTAAASLAGAPTMDAEVVRAFAEWHLGRTYRLQYQLGDADTHARKAITLAEDAIRRGSRTAETYQILAGARNVLAGALRREGHWEQSLALYQQVLTDTERRAQAAPASASLQRELANSHTIIADMLDGVDRANRKEVEYHVHSAIAIAERLAAADPGDSNAQSELGQQLENGGEILQTPAECDDSITYLRRAGSIFEALLKKEPDNTILLLYTGLYKADLGRCLGIKGSHRDAIRWLRRGFSELNTLSGRDPTNTVHQLQAVIAERWLVNSLIEGGRAREAEALAEEAIGKARLYTTNTGASPESRRELPRAYSTMARVYRMMGRHEQARDWYRMAFDEWERIRAAGVHFPESENEIAEARTGAIRR